ncbi:MAG: TolB family protein, partial [Planctomycetota bacterium]
MNADGTQPRRLARGGLPRWGPDSEHIYYQTRNDGMLYSISLARRDAEPQQITKYRTFSPSISPDGRRMVYLEGRSLKIMDLTSGAVVAEQSC